MLLLAKKKKPSSVIFPFFIAHRFTSTHHLHFFSASSSSSSQNPDPKPHFMADLLITTCGFTPDKATSIISTHFLTLKSPKRPESVLHFLNHHGFSNPEIKTLITCKPNLLKYSPDKTLHPNLHALRDIGLSTSALTQILLSGPAALHLRTAAPRIKFWRDFFQDDEAALAKAFRQNRSLIDHDTTQTITPKIHLLRSHGLCAHSINRILLTVQCFITRSVGLIESLLRRAKELGFRPESGIFVLALRALSCVNEESLKKKMEIFKSFGWSEAEFFSAFLKFPNMLVLSEKNLRMKMDFLVREVGCDPSYIASVPALLTYSMEKRLMPRHQVLHVLKSKGLLCKRHGFNSAISLPDKKFVGRYILPHKEEISGLHEAYLAACASGS